MITESNNETGLAMASSSSVFSSVSDDGISSLQGNNSSFISSNSSDLVNSEPISNEKARIDYGQLQRSVKLVQFLSLILLVMCAIIAALLLVGCSGKQTINNALDNANYAGELDLCKEKGKDAGSYNVYEKCAKDVDTKFGRVGK